ncbi:MAG: N-acetylmuramoyl-L-alanine amidase [Dehalococcoidia bacterium]
MALALGIGVTPLVAQDPSRTQRVTVQPGDTLSSLAVKFYGSVDAVERIAAANLLTDPHKIVAGTTLSLPAAEPATARTSASATATGRQMMVQPGDTLSAISQRTYGSPAYAAALAALNGLADPNLVVAGMKLTVPPTAPEGAGRSGVGAATGGLLAGRRVCIDAGHGGAEEPGSVFDFGDGRILRESDVTLDIARTVRGYLQADGAAVTMTRTGDAYLALEDRAALCNAAGADIAVSIHLNGGTSPSWNGALTLFFKSVDKRLADRMIMALQSGLEASAPSRPFTAYGAQPFEGRVLIGAAMPAVIVEPVFLSNPAEAQALLAPTSQQNGRRAKIALEIYRGIRLYFGQ